MKTVERTADGVEILQVTDGPELVDNIYCEASYCTPDSRWFVYRRIVNPRVTDWKDLRVEYVAVEFETGRRRSLGVGGCFPGISGAGGLFFAGPEKRLERILRVDIASGQSETCVVLKEDLTSHGICTVSADERWMALGTRKSFVPQIFGVTRIDLRNGDAELLFVSPSICNSHTQFDPGSHDILVQDNRGARFRPDGSWEIFLGPEGCTLFALNADDGCIHPLRIGPPFTPTATGHEQWIGRTGDVLLSIGAAWSDGARTGTILAARPGLVPARVVTGGARFSHIHAATDGKHFCTDAYEGEPARVNCYIGSLAAGRTLCVTSEAWTGAPKDAPRIEHLIHAHPYLSPDNRWMIFNSWRTGRPQVYAARLPAELWQRVDKG